METDTHRKTIIAPRVKAVAGREVKTAKRKAILPVEVSAMLHADSGEEARDILKSILGRGQPQRLQVQGVHLEIQLRTKR